MLSKSKEPVKPLRPKFQGQIQKSQSTHALDTNSSSQDASATFSLSFKDVVAIEIALEFVASHSPRRAHEFREIIGKVRKLPTK